MSPLLRLAPLVVLLAVSATGQGLNEKASRYYESLKKRPAPGPVFDRFVDAWLDSGNLEQLETFLAAKVKAEPSASGHLLLGLYHVRQGAHAKAVEQYRAALTLEPDNPSLWQQKALAESRLLEFDQAIASLEKGLEKKPAEDLSLAMRQLLGRLFSRAGRTSDALNVWQKLMAERPDDEALREDVLYLQLAEGLYDAAVENAAALVERAPDAYKKAMRRLQSAEVLDRAGRSDAAMAELEKCLADSGADSWLEKEVMARLDRIFRRDDNLSGLRAHLESLTQRQPQRQGLARARVRLLAELGEKSAAVEAGRALLALAPGDRPAREEFIALLVEAGRLEEAVAQAAELVRQTPSDRELLLRLATLKLQAGDKAGCLATVAEYDKLSGTDEAARMRSAALLEKAGLADEAIARLQAAAKEFPKSGAVGAALASSLHNAKRRDEALAEWKRQGAAATGPAFQDVARAMAAHGEEEAAWELLKTKVATADALLLTQLCQLAERLDRADEALPFVRRLVGMAQSAPDMDAALELASRLIKRAGESDNVVASIGADAGVADLCLLAELLEMRGDSSAAEDALQRAAKGAPDLAAAQLVRLYRLRQAWPQALEAGAKLFAAPGGKKAATAQSLADMAERGHDQEAALKWTREWRKLSPGAAPAVLAEARLLRAMGKDDEALKSLRLASGQFEENREIREELARLSRDSGKTSEALSLYAGLYEQAQDQSQKLRVVHEWAETAQEANRLPELLEQFEERRRQNRNATGPLLALAEIHDASGDRDKQRRALTDASRLRPEDADLAISLASMQEADDLIPLAIDTLRAALPHDKSGRVRHRLARLHFDAGDESAGMKLLEEPEDGTPPDAAAVESMATALTLTDPERALTLLTPRIAADPADYRLRFLRTRVMAELGQQTEAIREWSALLAVKDESPAVTSRRGSSIFSPETDLQLKKYAGLVPEEMLNLLRVRDLLNGDRRQNQYQYQSQYGPYSARSRAMFGGAQSRLPGNLAELRALVISSLMTASDAETEPGKAAIEALNKEGLDGLAAMLAGLVAEDPDPFARPTPRKFEDIESEAKKPGAKVDQNLRSGIAIIRCLTDAEFTPDSASAQRVWEHWHKTHFEFALTGALAGLTDSPVLDQWEKDVLAELLKLDRPSEPVIHGVTLYLQHGGVKRVDGGKTHAAILERATGWLESDWIAAPAFSTARKELAVNLLKWVVDMPEITARVMNAEWPREEKSTGAGTATGMMSQGLSGLIVNAGFSNYSGSDDFLAPLTWPVSPLPGVSPVFGRQNDGTQILSAIARKDAISVAPLVKHPVLAAWLKDYGNNVGHPVDEITKLASEKNADPTALVLAAVSAATAERFEDAARFATAALDRPLPGDLRRKINASIVSWADETMAETGSVLHTAARDAALRLRRDAQSYDQKTELAAAMETLGMINEANALKSAGMSGGLMNYALSYSSRKSPDGTKLQLLMREGKREMNAGDADAAVTIAKALRVQARHFLSPAGWGGSYDDTPSSRIFSGSSEDEVSWPDFLKLVKDRKALEEPTLKALTQSLGKETRQRAILAVAYELLDHSDRAVELFREVIAAGSMDPGVHVRLVSLLHKMGKEDEAEKSFVAAPPEAQEWLAGKFLRKGERETLTKVLQTAGMTLAALEKRDPALTTNYDWLTKMVTLLREDLEMTANLRAPKLEGPADDEPLRRPNRPEEAAAADLPKGKEQLQARRGAHEALCRKLLHVPGAAAVAFHSLRAVSPPEADLTSEAVTAFVTESRNATPTTLTSAALLQQQMFLRAVMSERDAKDDGFGLISPPVVETQDIMNAILQTCVKRNQPDALRNSLIPALQKAGSPKLAEQTALLTAIYFDAPESVEENARRLVATGGPTVWPAVVRGLQHRHAAADLSSLIISDVTRARTHPDDLPLAVRGAGEYCEWLCQEGRHAQARVLLERLIDVLTGSARQRASAFSSALTGGARSIIGSVFGGSNPGAPPPAQEAMELLKRLIRTPSSAFVALDLVYDGIVPGLSSDLASALLAQISVGDAPFTKPEFFRDKERVRQFFTGSPLVADVEQFRSYGGGSGLFFAVTGSIYEMGFEERKPALEVLRSLPPAFGRNVLIAAASDRWSCEALNAAAGGFEKIKALPAGNQAEMADLLGALSSGREMQKLTDSGQTLMKWVRDQQSLMLGEETEKRIEAFISTKSVSGGGIYGRNDPAATAAPLLEAAIKAMSPRAYDVVRRTSVMVPRQEVATTMGWLMAGYGSQFEHMVQNGTAGAGLPYGMPQLPPDRSAFRLGLLTNTMCAGDKRAPQFIDPLRLSLPRTVRWITNKLTGSPEERLTALVTALTPHVKEGEACVLLEAFPLPVTNSDTPESRAALRKAAIAWADGAGKSLPRQDLVQEIAAAARLEQFMETQPHAAGIMDEAALAPEQAHYLAVMRDEARGPAARLAVASLLADFAGQWLEPPLVAHLAGVLERTLTTRRPLEAWQRAAILRCLSRSAPSDVVNTAAKSLLARMPAIQDLRDDSARDEAKQYLALALRVNDSTAVVQSLASLQHVTGDPDVVGMVLATGDETRIANIVRDAEGKVYSPIHCGREVRFDERVAAALPQALAKAETDIVRFKIELAAHCLPSADGVKPRLERMTEIAARMTEVLERADKMVTDTLLDLLSVEPAAALLQRNYYDRALKNVSKDIFAERSSLKECRVRFWMVCLFGDAAAGDIAALTGRLDTFLASPIADQTIQFPDERGVNARTQTIHHICTGIAHGWPQWDATKRTAIRQWLLGRMKNDTLPGTESADELSLLPKELIEAINNEPPK